MKIKSMVEYREHTGSMNRFINVELGDISESDLGELYEFSKKSVHDALGNSLCGCILRNTEIHYYDSDHTAKLVFRVNGESPSPVV
jgi:hypothetical protein